MPSSDRAATRLPLPQTQSKVTWSGLLLLLLLPMCCIAWHCTPQCTPTARLVCFFVTCHVLCGAALSLGQVHAACYCQCAQCARLSEYKACMTAGKLPAGYVLQSLVTAFGAGCITHASVMLMASKPCCSGCLKRMTRYVPKVYTSRQRLGGEGRLRKLPCL